MATSENYLVSRKCWLKLHNSSQGEQETKKPKCRTLGWLLLSTAHCPSAGLPVGIRGTVESRCQAAAISCWSLARAQSFEWGQRVACAGKPQGRA